MYFLLRCRVTWEVGVWPINWKLGRQARRADLIDILTPARADEIASVDAQRTYYQDWLASLQQD